MNYGDYVKIDATLLNDVRYREHAIEEYGDLLADQLKATLRELYKGGLPDDVAAITLGWKCREWNLVEAESL